MDTRKKELRKISRGSDKVMAAIGELTQKDAFYPFSYRALDLDRQVIYSDEVNAELYKRANKKGKEAMQLIQEVGAAATAYAMRRYCDMLSDKSASKEIREKAITGAIGLLFAISKLGNEDTADINRQVMETAARDASMKDIYRITKKQFKARKTFYSPEIIQDIRQNSRVD